jgi:hypothetical protein
VDELCAAKIQSLPHYYGVMVWVLMMLEQWLQSRRASSLAAPDVPSLESAA